MNAGALLRRRVLLLPASAAAGALTAWSLSVARGAPVPMPAVAGVSGSAIAPSPSPGSDRAPSHVGDPVAPLATSPRAAAALRPTSAGADAPAGDADDFITTDMTSPDYDPMALMTAAERSPADTIALEKAQPRNPAFADPREAALRPVIEQRLASLSPPVPLAQPPSIRCYISSCELELALADGTPPADSDRVIDAVLAGIPLASGIQYAAPTEQNPRRRFWLGLIYSRDDRDHARFDRWLRARVQVPDAP